jgi:hypothetical protein
MAGADNARRVADLLRQLAAAGSSEAQLVLFGLATEVPRFRHLDPTAVDAQLLRFVQTIFTDASDLDVVHYLLRDAGQPTRPNLTRRREEAARRLNLGASTLRTRREPKLFGQLAEALLSDLEEGPLRRLRAYEYLRTDQTIRLAKDGFEVIDIHEIAARRELRSVTLSFSWSRHPDARSETKLEVLEGGELVNFLHTGDGAFTFTVDFGEVVQPGETRYFRVGAEMRRMDREEATWASVEPTSRLTVRVQALDVELAQVWRCEDIRAEEYLSFDPEIKGIPLPITSRGYASASFDAGRLPDHYYGIAWRLR